jgi:hypothetical protein
MTDYAYGGGPRVKLRHYYDGVITSPERSMIDQMFEGQLFRHRQEEAARAKRLVDEALVTDFIGGGRPHGDDVLAALQALTEPKTLWGWAVLDIRPLPPAHVFATDGTLSSCRRDTRITRHLAASAPRWHNRPDVPTPNADMAAGPNERETTMTDTANTTTPEAADTTPAAPSYEPSTEQLERRSTIHEARKVLSRGGLTGSFGGDTTIPDVSDLIDLSEYLRAGDVLLHDMDGDEDVIRTHRTVTPEAPVAEEASEPNVRNLFEMLDEIFDTKPNYFRVDASALADLPDEEMLEAVKGARRELKGLPDLIRKHRAECGEHGDKN